MAEARLWQRHLRIWSSGENHAFFGCGSGNRECARVAWCRVVSAGTSGFLEKLVLRGVWRDAKHDTPEACAPLPVRVFGARRTELRPGRARSPKIAESDGRADGCCLCGSFDSL